MVFISINKQSTDIDKNVSISYNRYEYIKTLEILYLFLNLCTCIYIDKCVYFFIHKHAQTYTHTRINRYI